MTKKPEGGIKTGRTRGPGKNGKRGYRSNLASAEYRWEVRCLDTKNGDVLWQNITRKGHPPMGRHLQNTYASETPITDGERVYAYFGMTGLYCYDMNGAEVWHKELERHDWGTSSSPLLHEGVLYLQVDSQDQSFLLALNAKTGDAIWRANRDEPSHYSSPIIWQNRNRTEVVTSGQSARSYDPKTGKLLWQLDLTGGRSAATPLAAGDRLFIGSEARSRRADDRGDGSLFAVKAGANETLDQENGDHVKWSLSRFGIQMASPVLCEGHLYLFERRRGVLHCVNAEIGKIAYEKRVSGARAFWSSPWVYQDKVFCLDDNGTTHVFQGGSEFKVLQTNKLKEQVWSTPAIANGMLFVRTADSLFCVGI
jgi:outer membrane protein assembly factor BamB